MPDLLAQYGQEQDLAVYNLKDLVYYGWFGWVAKPMLAHSARVLRAWSATTAWRSSC